MFRNFTKQESGATLVEFAQLLPIFMLLVLGIVDMSIFLSEHVLVEHALEVAGRQGAYEYGSTACTSTATQNFDDYVKAFWFGDDLSPSSAVVQNQPVDVRNYGTQVNNMPGLLLSVDMPVGCIFCGFLGLPDGAMMINKSVFFPTERCV
ncbi:MAG: pilus assembly protein [Bdellovibrionales bacterium]|nr:pilus assembly protein [Bdellovibrionales bacterium]